MVGVTALIPAHNEAASIGATIDALLAQTVTPQRIVVVADNCTDDTVAVARAHGAHVVETVGNTDRKAGALNQALAHLLPTMAATEVVLAQDADSTLSAHWIEVALDALETADAVGGVFHGDEGGGMLGALQRMEYARYARDLRRTGRVWVLTGTATMTTAANLRAVAEARGATLPGRHGDVYDSTALTEDMELTLALRGLGLRLVSPDECVVTTEVMTTLRDLFAQRLRWQRGAMENLRTYGFQRLTRPYFRQQALMALGVLALGLYVTVTVMWVATGQMGFSPLWTGIGAIFLTERVVTTWALGWRYRAIAALLIFDLLYDLFLQAVIVRAAYDAVLRRTERWHHPTDLAPTTL